MFRQVRHHHTNHDTYAQAKARRSQTAKRFIEMAREVGADETKECADRALTGLLNQRATMPGKTNSDPSKPFQLRQGIRYWAATCRQCGSPIPVGIAKPDARVSNSPDIRLKIVCVNAACLHEDTYGLGEIVPFLWPESREGKQSPRA